MILRNFLCGMAILALAACSKPVLDIAEPSEEQYLKAQTIIEDADIDPPRSVPQEDMSALVERILPPIRSAATQVCIELAQPAERCEHVRTARVTVYPDNPQINAYADASDSIGVYGGLVGAVGHEDEIAAILAHEYAHIIYGHVERKMNNAMVGLAIATGLSAALYGGSGSYDQQGAETIIQLGMEIGANAYSPELEIESDRTAIHILKTAGYSPAAMRDVLVRLSRVNKHGHNGEFVGEVGFFQTHPSDERRMAHIISAIEDAEAGIPLIVATDDE